MARALTKVAVAYPGLFCNTLSLRPPIGAPR